MWFKKKCPAEDLQEKIDTLEREVNRHLGAQRSRSVVEIERLNAELARARKRYETWWDLLRHVNALLTTTTDNNVAIRYRDRDVKSVVVHVVSRNETRWVAEGDDYTTTVLNLGELGKGEALPIDFLKMLKVGIENIAGQRRQEVVELEQTRVCR